MGNGNGALAVAQPMPAQRVDPPTDAAAFSERVAALVARIDLSLAHADSELTKVEQGIARLRERRDA